MPILDASSSDSSPNAHPRENKTQKSFSCVLCSQRKVKCDRRPGGCANCAKGRVPCIYRAPPPPRRRKKGVRDVDTTARLRIYEDALQKLGVDPEDVVRQAMTRQGSEGEVPSTDGFFEGRLAGLRQKTQYAPEVGVLISDEGKTRYLENGIWTSLRSEFRDSKELLEESSDEDEAWNGEGLLTREIVPSGEGNLLFASPATSIILRSLHPEPLQIFKIWQLYLDNINPLVKVFHAPSIQQLISDHSGNTESMPRSFEALLFAIYCITVESLSNAECLSVLGKTKTASLQLYRFGAQQALVNANFMRSSDIMVLQAFTLFILSLQNFDARIVWIWSGITQRIGQRIGLHRDGAQLGQPPFETEMRRRLWWQIMMLEGYSQKLAGTGSAGTILTGDVAMPANVNDSDLFPAMKEPPKEHEGATEMMFFLIRCHVGDFLKRSADAHTTFDGVWHRITSRAVQVAVKDRAISELESLFQRKFLQYCDPSIPWHFMCNQLGKTVIFMMRFMAHSALYSTGDLSQPEKDSLFDTALKVLSSQNLTYTIKEMQGFMWHVNLHFQWKAFVFVLSELRYRTVGPQVDQAWKEIEKSYDFHPSFDKAVSKRALPVAVNNLTLKAWEVYIKARGIPQGGEPYFIQLIRSRRPLSELAAARAPLPGAHTSVPLGPDVPQNIEYPNDSGNLPIAEAFQAFDWDVADFAGLGTTSNAANELLLDVPENIDWNAWDDLVVDFQANAVAGAEMGDFSSFTFE